MRSERPRSPPIFVACSFVRYMGYADGRGTKTMATSGQLVRAVARVTGIDDKSVAVRLRSLREAGKITVGGRGLSAAQMTPRDAAHLIVAIMGSTLASEADEADERLFGLKGSPAPRTWTSKGRAPRRPSEMARRLAERGWSTFGEVLAGCIELHAAGHLLPEEDRPLGWSALPPAPLALRLLEEPTWRVRVFSPLPAAIVEYGAGRFFESYVFGEPGPVPNEGPFHTGYGWYLDQVARVHPEGRIVQVRELGHAALEHVADAIADRVPDEV